MDENEILLCNILVILLFKLLTPSARKRRNDSLSQGQTVTFRPEPERTHKKNAAQNIVLRQRLNDQLSESLQKNSFFWTSL